MTTTATHLRTTAIHWQDLHEAAGQPTTIGAFGLGLKGYLARLNDADTEQIEYERHHAAYLRSLERDPGQIGATPAPVRLQILDTMRVIEAALVQCADQIASSVQRSVMAHLPAGYPPADRARRAQLVVQDREDPRRWSWTGTRPGAIKAALWLLARVEGAPGPFRPLTGVQLDHIAAVAAGAADRLERALDIAAQRRTLAQCCPCGGRIDVHGGEGRAPLAHCAGCGRVWSEGGIVAA
ncbi:hypothetical protein [Streptomyces sp. bgisy154]|uniref:hypothetical protein n=1 Tax=Streptomyces sp. bgisy154 TaxID=3413794 RepID=UPI003D71053F